MGRGGERDLPIFSARGRAEGRRRRGRRRGAGERRRRRPFTRLTMEGGRAQRRRVSLVLPPPEKKRGRGKEATTTCQGRTNAVGRSVGCEATPPILLLLVPKSFRWMERAKPAGDRRRFRRRKKKTERKSVLSSWGDALR